MSHAYLKQQLSTLAVDYDTRHGFAAIMWECWKRLSSKKRIAVIEVMESESSIKDIKHVIFVDQLAELLR